MIKRSLGASALLSSLLFCAAPVYASDNTVYVPSVHVNQTQFVQSAPTVHAQINGHTYPAIAIHGITYLLWGSLKLMNTPYRYLGHGEFYIAGHNVQGAIYRGQTYLPWYCVGGTPVDAQHITNGWNFTHKWTDAATDGYKLNVILADNSTKPGEFVPMWIQTFRDNGTQVDGKINIKETSDRPDYGVGGAVNCSTPFYWPETLLDSGHSFIDVTWIDPNNVLHTIHKTLTVGYPQSTNTPIPSDDSIVAQIPARFVNDQVFFDSKVNGVPVGWQLDTGAQVPTLNGADSAKLNLPHEQQITIVGVTGSDVAYISHMDVTIGGVEFKHVLCIIYPNMKNTSLFGFSFFAEQHYDLLVSEKHNTITILK